MRLVRRCNHNYGKGLILLYATDGYAQCGLCARRPLPYAYAHFFLCSLLKKVPGVSPTCLTKTPR